MTRLPVVAIIAIAGLAACSADDTVRSGGAPVATISDGAHQQPFNDPNGNPDFFFLPPTVDNPINDPDWSAGEFNPKLEPYLEVCALALGPTAVEADVTFTTPCSPGGYLVTIPAPLDSPFEQYQGDWQVPVNDTAFYRIRVKVGDIVLGFADAHTVANPRLLNTVDQTRFVGKEDGATLPVKFRVEIGALCTPAGLRPCDSSTLALQTGGTVNISTDGGTSISGVSVPAQNSQSGKHTFTVQSCDDLNPRAIDLPTFGSCLRVSPTPALAAPLGTLATVQVCDLAPDIIASGLSEDQEEQLTMHRLHGTTVQALPHVAGCTIVTGMAPPTLRSVVRELARGHLGGAVGKLFQIVGPAPLVARRLDVGGGGGAAEFSDFQFALPAKMETFAGNGQTAAHGTTLPVAPTVRVTDLYGVPVANATVRFNAVQGSFATAAVTTAADGLASSAWTLGPTIGTQTAVASGRGIAGENADGPRAAFDPFISIQANFNPGGDPVPNPPQGVIVQTGTRTFTASSIVPFGAAGYSYKVVTSTTASPTGWQLAGFNAAGNGFTAGVAPFASSGKPCFYTATTPWAVKTDILVRKTFELGGAATVQVRLAIDKDVVEIYLNGVAMTGGPLSASGCAVPGSAENSFFSGAGIAGTNLLAVRVKARSTSSFFDSRISAP